MEPPALLPRAAVAAATNANALFRDAQLLLQAKRYPRTVSLSIIGYEEVGKALLFALAATGRVAGIEAVLLMQRTQKNPVRHHLTKQYIVEIAGVLADHFREFDRATDVPLLLDTLAAEVDRALPMQKTASDYYERLEQLILQDTPPQVPKDYAPEQRKWNGLYVDIQENVVCVPEDTSGLEAYLALKDLELVLDALQPLLKALSDDKEWLALSGVPLE